MFMAIEWNIYYDFLYPGGFLYNRGTTMARCMVYDNSQSEMDDGFTEPGVSLPVKQFDPRVNVNKKLLKNGH